MATQAATIKNVSKPIPGSLNYTEVFYSNKRTVLTLGGAHPGKELMDIFGGQHKDPNHEGTLGRDPNDDHGSPIREDMEEHHDIEALLERDDENYLKNRRGGRNALAKKQSSRAAAVA